jgi:hypothetical protein
MKPFNALTICFLTLLLVTVDLGLGQDRDRGKIPDKYKWNLTDLFVNNDA